MRLSGPQLTDGRPNPLAADTIWEYRLFGWSVSVPIPDGSNPPYPVKTTTADFAAMPDVAGVFLAAVGFLAGALLAGAAFVVLQVTESPGRIRVHAWALGIASALFGASAVAIAALQLPQAVNLDIVGSCPGGTCFRTPGYFQGFWGSLTWGITPDFYVVHSYGAGWGWYLAVASAILFLAAGVSAYRARNAQPASLGQ